MSVRRVAVAILGSSLCLLAAAVTFPAPASAAVFHGIAFAKGCNTPIVVGQLYTCDVLTINNIDTGPDTLTITSVVDVVHAAAGDQTSPNLLPTLTLGFTGGASCNIGHTVCTLPPGASIFTTTSYGFYITVPADPNPLADTATLTWQDLCTSGAPNCPIGNQTASSGSSAQLVTPTATVPPPPAVPVGGYTDVELQSAHSISDARGPASDGLVRQAITFLAPCLAVGLLALSGVLYVRRRERR